MKLNQLLSLINQVEKSKFITNLDKLCTSAAQDNKSLAKSIDKIDGQIKNASGSEILQLFFAVEPYYKEFVNEQILMSSAQVKLLINILTRDGNCVARLSWIEQLYTKEWKALDKLSKELKKTIESEEEVEFSSRQKALAIYHACMFEAYNNDLKNNRESKVSDDERSILNVLAEQLNLSTDECAAIEHLVDKIPKNGVLDALNKLRDLGLVFISKKRQEVFMADEIVKLLNEIQGKDLSDKHILRILRTFSDAELSNILKAHGRKIRGIDRLEKIQTIMHAGLTAKAILSEDMFTGGETQNSKKERLKQLINDLDISVEKLGTTLDERIEMIFESFLSAADKEFETLSNSGFKELLSTLEKHHPSIVKSIRTQYEIEEAEQIDTEKLRALSITPHDILFMLSNDEIKTIRDDMGLSKRGNPRFLILESFADATDKLIDNYDALARRDLNSLKEANIEISEADLGVKFEEVTKAIFAQLNLNVDEDTRKEVNTAKDKADIVISLNDNDVIIGEAKTSKNGDFAKYSSTSRQVKAYVNRAENIGKRVSQVLIVAPSFSEDFVESAEMDTEINISLLEAKGLKAILDSFKSKRTPKFSPNLLTKGGLLKAELIAKNI